MQDLAKFPDLQRLSLVGCNIRGNSLATLPPLLHLTSLTLADNAIAGNLDSLTSLTTLQDLDLSGNRISDLSTLSPLVTLTSLTSLDISGCPVETTKGPVNTRISIFDMLAVLPALKYVNGEDFLSNGEIFLLFFVVCTTALNAL